MGARPVTMGAEAEAAHHTYTSLDILDMSVTSDALSFLQRPLCAQPVSGHQVASPSKKRLLAKKIKSFSQQIRGIKSSRNELKTLAVL